MAATGPSQASPLGLSLEVKIEKRENGDAVLGPEPKSEEGTVAVKVEGNQLPKEEMAGNSGAHIGPPEKAILKQPDRFRYRSKEELELNSPTIKDGWDLNRENKNRYGQKS